MDLEKELKSHPELSSCLDDIIKSCNKIWANPLLPWFTKHDVSHSQEIVHLLGQILSPLEETPQKLNEHELFILLASAYLHDIGMQNLKVVDISIDKLTSEEYEQIRKMHAEESFNIILKRLNKTMERDDFHLPIIKDDYISIIARVSKGHATDFFEESIDYFQQNPAEPLNRSVRADLLTALLMIADELDLQSKRAEFSETAKSNLSDYSAVHWYKHHYVASVEVDKGTVHLTLQFPADASEYDVLIKELIETKLKEQIEKVNPMLNESTGGLLHLNDIEIQTQVDNTGTKRKLPDGALEELKKILKEPVPVTSDVKEVEHIITHSIPRASSLFTGRNADLKKPDSPNSSWLSSTFNISKIIWWVLGILGAIIAGIIIPHCTKSPHQGQKSDAASSFQDRLLFIKAAKEGNVSAIELLLDKGVDVNTIGRDGNTALIWAARHGQRACVQKLIEKGSKVDVKNSVGWTALITASRDGHKAVVELLIENAADVNAKANDGNTAFTYASAKGYDGIVDILKKYGAVTVKYQDPKILTAAFKGDVNTLKGLLEKGVSPNTIDQIGGETPLMYAMGRNHFECAKLLLEFEADINIRAKNGHTVLDVIKGRPEMLELIEIYGAKR